jgi:AraC-like DNA-binding protein
MRCSEFSAARCGVENRRTGSYSPARAGSFLCDGEIRFYVELNATLTKLLLACRPAMMWLWRFAVRSCCTSPKARLRFRVSHALWLPPLDRSNVRHPPLGLVTRNSSIPHDARLPRVTLLDRSLSIGEIAYLLGYSEPPAFHRAFKRWNGITAQEFRQQRAGDSALSVTSQ